jgi:hypothetical protein
MVSVLKNNATTPEEAKKGSVDAKAKKLAEATGKAPVNLTEDQLKVVGTMSDSLQYMGVLVHPTKLQGIGKRKGPNGETVEDMKNARFLVGLRFKVLKPLDVPDFGRITSNSDVQAQEHVGTGSKHYEPGAIVDMTPLEFGVLTARPEFDGQITGGDDENLHLFLSLRNKTPKQAKGVASKGNDLQTVVVKFKSTPYARGPQFEIPVGQVITNAEGKKSYAPFPEGSKEAQEFAKWTALVTKPTTAKIGTHSHKTSVDRRADAYTDPARRSFLTAVARVAQNQHAAAK